MVRCKRRFKTGVYFVTYTIQLSYLKSLGIGVKCGQEKVFVLLYADGIVLFSESEQYLQVLLNALQDWCKTEFVFRCGCCWLSNL